MKLLALLFALVLAIPLHAGISVTTPVYALVVSQNAVPLTIVTTGTGTALYQSPPNLMATFTLPADVGAGDDAQPFDDGQLYLNGVWYDTGYEIAAIDFNALYAEGY